MFSAFHSAHIAAHRLSVIAIVSAGFMATPVLAAQGRGSSAAQDAHTSAPAAAASSRRPDHLRVCADPNNLPFSNARREGFENLIIELIGRDLGRRVTYFWAPQRRGFFRTTIRAKNCDVVPGVPAELELVRATRPYYRSTYVFVSRRDRRLDLRSFDDPRLKRLIIGIPITGEDFENPPAAQALAARHLVENVRGFTVYGDYSRPEPQRELLDAVADGRVDVAVAWGPVAGYFARREPQPLTITPVSVENAGHSLRFVFEIAMGVRRDDQQLHDQLDAALARHAGEIRRILEKYGVPLVGR